MIVYSATKAEFRADVVANRVADKVREAVYLMLGRRTADSEFASWQNSLLYMNNVLLDEEIPEETGVAIEYGIPTTSKRIDFLLTGQDEGGRDTMVIVELKQWSEVSASDLPDCVTTILGGGLQSVPHPSYQAYSYATLLRDFNEEVYSTDVTLAPCCYLHNCDSSAILKAPSFEHLTVDAPIFLRSDAAALAEFIRRHVKTGDRGALLYRIDQGRIRPSKQLAEHLVGLLQGNRSFVLIDEQKLVYERSLERVAKAIPEGRKKQVVIVEGGPGTGKSVVAVNLLVALVGERELNAQYVTNNSAPRAVYKETLAGETKKARIEALFSGSGSYIETAPNTFDCLVVDEAHRLAEKSGLYKNLGNNQIAEIVRAARSAIFFVDDRQQVTLRDIGDRESIAQIARGLGAETTSLELASQFRCNGSDAYLAWLDHVLQIESTAHTDLDGIDFDFRVCESPNELRDLIRVRNEGRNKSRLVAGYCWPWDSKKDSRAMDVVIPEHDFEMQWNFADHGGLWILQEESVEQIGCIHTCQGLELDYVGVILGPDLVVRDGEVVTDATERATYDSSVRGIKKMLKENPVEARAIADRIVKNTYRTLMSRGMRGCYVFSVDPETNEWLRAAVNRSFLDKKKVAPGVAGATEPEEAPSKSDAPLPFLTPAEAESSKRAVPFYDLAVAAGLFSEEQTASAEEWVELPGDFNFASDLFLTRVVGESMNRRVPNGSYCLFKARPAGTRQNRIVLVQHRDIADPEHGGRFTLKRYTSEVQVGEDGRPRKRVVLRPESDDPAFEPIVIEDEDDERFQVLAELVAVLH
ncbi:MAG: DUF2075 domain-containing protein [Acidobacteria bacterium]|nr:MAG: DUF2075 domain-containing protein [Acidobacteriota bacterium]